MLYLRQILRGPNHSPQALIIKFVGGSARRFSAEYGAHRDDRILFCDVLMNGVVSEASECKVPAGKLYFDFIRNGNFPNAVKEVTGLLLRQHFHAPLYALPT